MSRRITFEFDARRFVTAAAYLVERCPDVTKMKLSKLLYYVDKAHLLTYGKPVTGDRYVKMDFGPVPSAGYNLMKHNDWSPVEDQALFDQHLSVSGNDITLAKLPNLRCLSETNKEVLEAVIAKYGHLTSAQLSKLSHHEPAWRTAEINGPMDYRLFFEESDDSLKDLVEQDQELRDALSDIEFEEVLESLRP